MKRLPAIKSVMTPFPYSIDIDAPVSEAQQYMRGRKIRHLPVTENEQLVGLLADRDIRAHGGVQQKGKTAEPRVRDVNPERPYVVDLNERLDKVLLAMAERHVDAVLITRRGKLAGVFTVTDACRSYAEYLRRQFSPPGGNEAA